MVINGPYMVINGPYMVINGPYMVINGPIYGDSQCATLLSHPVLCTFYRCPEITMKLL